MRHISLLGEAGLLLKFLDLIDCGLLLDIVDSILHRLKDAPALLTRTRTCADLDSHEAADVGKQVDLREIEHIVLRNARLVHQIFLQQSKECTLPEVIDLEDRLSQSEEHLFMDVSHIWRVVGLEVCLDDLFQRGDLLWVDVVSVSYLLDKLDKALEVLAILCGLALHHLL